MLSLQEELLPWDEREKEKNKKMITVGGAF
jgi:hypothetical protein